MKVILHIGAHRCATTTFQDHVRQNGDALREMGIGFWGPGRTRNGLFHGLLPTAGAAKGRDLQRRAVGRVRLNLARSADSGVRTLLVSDENMLGGMRENVLMADLYCGVGERMARFNLAFGGDVGDVMLNIRAQDSYWPSAIGYQAARGRAWPGAGVLERVAGSPRMWRDVITDVACAMPEARIWVLPFETFAGRPEAQLRAITGQNTPRNHARGWLNATPRLPQLRDRVVPQLAAALPPGDGRWNPFTPAQRAALAEAYADDMMWLRGGADGLASLMDDPDKKRHGETPASSDLTRGRPHDHEKGRMAKAR